MTDEYQNAVKKLTDYIGDTVNFAKDQLPDVAKEILVYNTQVDHIWLIGFGIMFFICALSFVIGIMADSEGAGVSGGLLGLFAAVSFGCVYSDLIKIETAPKLYVMDEMAHQIHKSQCSK